MTKTVGLSLPESRYAANLQRPRQLECDIQERGQMATSFFRSGDDTTKGGVGDPKRRSARNTIEFKGAEDHVVKIDTCVPTASGASERDLTNRQPVIGIRIGVCCYLGTWKPYDRHDTVMCRLSSFPIFMSCQKSVQSHFFSSL
jgi:hypothetical protein